MGSPIPRVRQGAPTGKSQLMRPLRLCGSGATWSCQLRRRAVEETICTEVLFFGRQAARVKRRLNFATANQRGHWAHRGTNPNRQSPLETQSRDFGRMCCSLRRQSEALAHAEISPRTLAKGLKEKPSERGC